jgi:hypothetical protein
MMLLTGQTALLYLKELVKGTRLWRHALSGTYTYMDYCRRAVLHEIVHCSSGY